MREYIDFAGNLPRVRVLRCVVIIIPYIAQGHVPLEVGVEFKGPI